ncbi:unnamed protein product [Staurois parvus]|uniref:Uncharacterized protein n=1 Tax=Staurois parvus TaxID=386267 RepID=A0ABN9H9T8_9NEOB|nr:unnamed protein product [Staurois parvus]
MILHFRGSDLCVNNTGLSPASNKHAAVLCTAEKYTAACFPSKTHTAHTVKWHTVNPFIVPYVNPFLPSVISTVSVLFISTDHCISVIGISVAVSQFPSSVRMPAAVPL